jgi:hypothetical protein
MDHNESIRKFEHLMLKGADHAHEAAVELEALIPLLPTENSRRLAHLQVEASHKHAREFREPEQKVKESGPPLRAFAPGLISGSVDLPPRTKKVVAPQMVMGVTFPYDEGHQRDEPPCGRLRAKAGSVLA